MDASTSRSDNLPMAKQPITARESATAPWARAYPGHAPWPFGLNDLDFPWS
jgi:hypothetical protein